MKKQTVRQNAPARAAIEALESRVVLDAIITSVVVGDMLFTAVASDLPAGGTDLFRSDLDGSDQVLLGHWYSNGDYGPKSLYGFHDTLYFAATKQDSWSRTFLWKSDGTPHGTVPVPGNYLLQYGSYPHDFMNVNDHLLYLAEDNAHKQQVFATNGLGYGQLIVPRYGTSFSNLMVTEDRLYVHISSPTSDQVERWETDGSRAGTVRWYGGYIHDNELRIFGTDGDDRIRVSTNQGMVVLDGAGAARQVFLATHLRSIVLHAQLGSDQVHLDPRIEQSATINGGGGDDSLYGGGGNDLINGDSGRDFLVGGFGDDSLRGGSGFDQLIGGPGNDTFAYDGSDYILDLLSPYPMPPVRTPTRPLISLLV